GYIYCAFTGGQFGSSRLRIFTKWMEDWGEDQERIGWMKDTKWEEEYDMTYMNQEKIDRLEASVTPFLLKYTMKELYEEALKRGHWLVPIGTPKSICEDSQLAYREFWEDIDHPELGATITYPGWPIKQSETPWTLQHRAPLIGEHNKEIYEKELGFSKEEMIMLKSAGIV
ncbi:MAG: CoA transferase, partial [Thermodesulfobacteriota bacterium]|nr:CoA transferase [Thermodesulfobacteriota bacterium]